MKTKKADEDAKQVLVFTSRFLSLLSSSSSSLLLHARRSFQKVSLNWKLSPLLRVEAEMLAEASVQIYAPVWKEKKKKIRSGLTGAEEESRRVKKSYFLHNFKVVE